MKRKEIALKWTLIWVIVGIDEVDSITDDMCTQSKSIFNDIDDFANKGSMKVDNFSFTIKKDS